MSEAAGYVCGAQAYIESGTKFYWNEVMLDEVLA